jgi:hypothetical protein
MKALYGDESGPTNVKRQGGSSIAITAVSKDRLNYVLLLVVLSEGYGYVW